MRLNMKKILKDWDDTNDKSDCFINRMHTSGLAPYSENILTADDRAKVFTGTVDGLIARSDWTLLGLESSKTLMRKIRDAKKSPKTYAIMLIDDTLYDTHLVYHYLKHYQRANDVIHMFKMENVKEDAPILLTTNREWYCVIAPRMEAEGYENQTKETAPVLFKIEPKEEPMVFDDEPTFNPITGVFE
tara:strand:- start:2495 stop:3058 length:564 start_codon:yes stop_codon:yes gene_type:complete